MTVKYKYKKTGDFYRPLIDIKLRNGAIEIGYIALVDSGADYCIFHSDTAALLGVDLNKLKTSQFAGIGKDKTYKSYMGMIDIGIQDIYYTVPVFFSADISANSYGILGQIGFFDKFKVTFNYKNKTIFLK